MALPGLPLLDGVPAPAGASDMLCAAVEDSGLARCVDCILLVARFSATSILVISSERALARAGCGDRRSERRAGRRYHVGNRKYGKARHLPL